MIWFDSMFILSKKTKRLFAYLKSGIKPSLSNWDISSMARIMESVAILIVFDMTLLSCGNEPNKYDKVVNNMFKLKSLQSNQLKDYLGSGRTTLTLKIFKLAK